MTSLLISALVGLGIPALVAVITREALPAKPKALILLFLSTVTGIITGLATHPPHGLSQWEHVFSTIIVAYITAAASLVATWERTGGTAAIHKATDTFGIGPTKPPTAS